MASHRRTDSCSHGSTTARPPVQAKPFSAATTRTRHPKPRPEPLPEPLPQVFTITTPPAQQEVEAADRLVRQLSPGARKTYALGGTQKYELPTSEVSLSQVRQGSGLKF